jgi:hypothetical protein
MFRFDQILPSFYPVFIKRVHEKEWQNDGAKYFILFFDKTKEILLRDLKI